MPINFITGLPRSGKTLWTLTQIRSRAEKENRQVYYCNIPEVTIPGWIEIDHPDKWLELPDGAIVLVDELQDFWGKQPTGAKVPAPILELSKHGKRGFDFYFITQEPELVHTTPRGLCQFHYYVIRAFGANACVIYKFERMQTHPEKVKKKGEKFPWAYNKQAFTWYKSADVHNIKRQIPKKLIALPFVALLAIGAIWAAIALFSATTDKAKGASKGAVPGQTATAFAGQPAAANGKQPPMTAFQYLESYSPRVNGLAHTAPAYDDLTKPKRVPVPAACMESKSAGCKCWTQQATPYDATPELCRQIVRNGIFLAFVPDGEKEGVQTAAPGAYRANAQEVAVQPQNGLTLMGGSTEPVAAPVAPPAAPAQARVQSGSKWSFQPGA